jgi:hypothetical protein
MQNKLPLLCHKSKFVLTDFMHPNLENMLLGLARIYLLITHKFAYLFPHLDSC